MLWDTVFAKVVCKRELPLNAEWNARSREARALYLESSTADFTFFLLSHPSTGVFVNQIFKKGDTDCDHTFDFEWLESVSLQLFDLKIKHFC